MVFLLYGAKYFNAGHKDPRILRQKLRTNKMYSKQRKRSANREFKNPTISPENHLSQWKVLYNNQNEMYMNIIKLRSKEPSDLPDFAARSKVYDSLVDLNLFQLLSMENMKSEMQDSKAHQKLTSYVSKVIEQNQNPANCTKIKVIGYELKNICGFGCQIHHLAYVLSVSLGEGKPLVIKENKWHGFHSLFNVIEPLSNSCLYHKGNMDIKYIDITYSYPISKYTPPIFPEELREDIGKFHTTPFVWWIGQIIKYILRLSTRTIYRIQPITLEHPIVGVHVRRTDKLIWEAKYYSVDEYMSAVDLYYRKLEIKTKIPIKRVYLSSDVPNLIDEFRKGYPNYVFISSPVKGGGPRSSRENTYSIISDIYHLSQTDYLVCTFSSNVCRLAYEWMNSQHIDASENYYSLDNIYHYARQNKTPYTIHMNHSDQNIHLDKNTIVNLQNYNSEREIKVNILKSNQEVSIPYYKLKENPQTAKFKAFEKFKMDP